MSVDQSLDIVIPVYNGADVLKELIPDIRSWVCTNNNVHIYVVNDGSEDALDEIFPDDLVNKTVTLIDHDVNRGRGAARNTGFRAGNGMFVAFLDVDCRPSEGWIKRFIESLVANCEGVFGNIKATGDSFLSSYSNLVHQSKAKKYKQNPLVLSTAFCAFRRDKLEAVGGFYEGYRHYGFEDRDLISSLIASGCSSFCFLEDVSADHYVEDSLSSLEAKMKEAACFTAPVYSGRFLKNYRKSQYWWFDSRVHGRVYNIFLSILLLPRFCVSAISRRVLKSKYTPFVIKRLLVSYLMAVSFVQGSR